MDYQDYITVKAERKKGQHLGAEERGAIKVLVKQGLGIRAIARAIGCAPSTVTNELQRGSRTAQGSNIRPLASSINSSPLLLILSVMLKFQASRALRLRSYSQLRVRYAAESHSAPGRIPDQTRRRP